MFNLCVTLIIFLIYSFFGWIIEIIDIYAKKHRIINRGFFIGPICPIYGVGGLLLVFLLSPYISNPFVVFGMSILIFSILEYSTSFVMEKLFHARWWDYSDYTFNINGRICLETMIPFGLLGLFILYIVHPVIFNTISSLSPIIIYIISGVLATLFLSDVIISSVIIIKYGVKVKKIHADSTEEITNQVRQEFIKSSNVLKRRLMKAFPRAQVTKKQKDKRAKNR